MKIWKLNLYALCLCTALTLACTPEEEENTSPDKPDTEIPEVPDRPDVPDVPEEPDPDIPEEDGGNSGKPETGGGEVTPPDEPADYTEQAKVIETRDFTKSINLSAYQMIDADGIPIDHPFGIAGWNHVKEGSNYNLTSFMFDKNNEHDHWLITEGFYIAHDYPKVIITWTMQSDYFPESYEVYLSSSPNKESFTKLIYSGIQEPGETQADYLLEGYEGQTIYLAFRHNTPGETKWTLSLKNLTISSFPYDKQDLVADKLWLSYPKFLPASSNVATGTVYPAGVELNVSVAIKNIGIWIKGENLSVTYDYDGTKVTEEIPNVYLSHGETYVYTFNRKLTTQAKDDEPLRPVSVTVKPLPNEVRVKKNSRYIEISHLTADPH